MSELSSGKGAADENFPVASHLIAPRHRGPILAFYAVARLADDVADHAGASPEVKLARLAEIEASLEGRSQTVPSAAALGAVLAERGLPACHMLDLLEAFRRDVVKDRYADWGELMDYCRFSAAPVGRFVLDVHGESRGAWPASDALCAALQVINHLQDCGKDWRALRRVYLPADRLAAHGARAEALGEGSASPALRTVIAELAGETQRLLARAAPLAAQVESLRLALEIGAIQRLAEDLAVRLRRRDPLSEPVHHRPFQAASAAIAGGIRAAAARFGRSRRGGLVLESP